ncbi:hypothetical protein ACROYT_G031716 [Oculina patagonica]
MFKAGSMYKKKGLEKSCSSFSKKKLKSKQEKDGSLVTELERLITETYSESQNVPNEEPQLSVLPKCPINKSELKPFKAQKTEEPFFKCLQVGCGVMCFVKDLLGYCEVVLQKLHSSFSRNAPVCGCGMLTLLNVREELYDSVF